MTKPTTRLLSAWLFTCLLGSLSPVLAQSQLTDRDKLNINAAAIKSVSRLSALLNALAVEDLAEEEIETVIKLSYTGPARLFDNSHVSIEDDINPSHTSANKTQDLKVDEYLNRFSLYYAKRSTNDAQLTIIFSDLDTTIPQDAGSSIYIKVFFKSDFKGKYVLNAANYLPNKRVVELRAEKSGQYWKVYITRLGFIQPGEGIQQTANASPDPLSKPRVTTGLHVNKGENLPAASTAHPPALQAKTYSPPPKVVISSMPSEPHNVKKVMSVNSLPDNLKKPKP